LAYCPFGNIFHTALKALLYLTPFIGVLGDHLSFPGEQTTLQTCTVACLDWMHHHKETKHFRVRYDASNETMEIWITEASM